MPEDGSNRLNRLICDLLAGKPIRVGPADAPDRQEILLATRLAATRESYPRMRAGLRRKIAAELRGAPTRGFPTRRAAIVAGLGVAVGAAAGLRLGQLGPLSQLGPVGQLAAFSHPTPTVPPRRTTFTRQVIEPLPGRWVDVGLALDDLVDGQAHRISVGAFNAFLFRNGTEVTGTSSVCTHLPCELGWDGKQRILVCPCHNQSFEVTGESSNNAYPLPPLPVVRVKVVDGRIKVLGT